MAKKPSAQASTIRTKSQTRKPSAQKRSSAGRTRSESALNVVASAVGGGPGVVPAAAEEFSIQAIRLAFLIHDVSRMRRAVYDQLMKPLNFTRARWWVLAHLSRHDGMMQSQLADVLEVGKASLGSVVEQLEADGWLERRSDPSDKRAKRVYLTRSAQPFIKKMTLEEDEFNHRILAGLDGADRANLIRMMSLIKVSLQQFAKSDAAED